MKPLLTRRAVLVSGNVIRLQFCEGHNLIGFGETHCNNMECQPCCPHDERDHGICLGCGQEEDPGAAIDYAMDYYEGER